MFFGFDTSLFRMIDLLLLYGVSVYTHSFQLRGE